MSSKTKIIVLRMKEIIYTALFIGFAIVLIMLFLFMFRPKKDNISHDAPDQASESSSQAAPASVTYVPGLYSSPIVLGSENVNVEVAVDHTGIRSVSLVPLSDSVETMYPLMDPRKPESGRSGIPRRFPVHLHGARIGGENGALQGIREVDLKFF